MWKAMRPKKGWIWTTGTRNLNGDKDTRAEKGELADLTGILCSRKNTREDSHHWDIFKPYINKTKIFGFIIRLVLYCHRIYTLSNTSGIVSQINYNLGYKELIINQATNNTSSFSKRGNYIGPIVWLQLKPPISCSFKRITHTQFLSPE